MSATIVQFTLRNGRTISVAIPNPTQSELDRFRAVARNWKTRDWGQPVELRFEYRDIVAINFLEETP